MRSNTVLGKDSTYCDCLGCVCAAWLTKWKKKNFACASSFTSGDDKVFLCPDANFHDTCRNLSAFRLNRVDQFQLYLTEGYKNC